MILSNSLYLFSAMSLNKRAITIQLWESLLWVVKSAATLHCTSDRVAYRTQNVHVHDISTARAQLVTAINYGGSQF